MKITAIKQQVKRADRYSIYIDDKYSFSLSEPELVRMGLLQGLTLSPTELQQYLERSLVDKAADRA